MPQITNLQVTKLMIQQTGTYNDQFLRPYETSIDHSTMEILVDRFAANAYKTEVAPTEISDIVGSMLKPQSEPETNANITNSWQERRLRFTMQVCADYTSGGRVNYFIFGYTDFAGITNTGNVSPDMIFYVNSIVSTRQATRGGQSIWAPFGADHVHINENQYNIHQSEQRKLIRPVDVYNTNHNHVVMAERNYQGTPMFDTRNSLTRRAMSSSRENMVPSNFAAKVISGKLKAIPAAANSTDPSAINDAAGGFLNESILQQNPFINAISKIQESGQSTSMFTYRDLLALDSNVDNNLIYATMNNSVSQTHSAGQTQHWAGSDLATQTAFMLAHAVPAIMLSLGITTVTLTSSNDFMDSQIHTTFLNGNTLTGGDISTVANSFVATLNHTVIMSMTHGNQMSYLLDMNVDVFGETWIKIAIGDTNIYEYVAPSFCDSLYAPTVTGNNDRVLSVARDFGHVVDNIQERIGYATHNTYNTNAGF